MFMYCAKCGYIAKSKHNSTCPVCEACLQPVPSQFLTASCNLFISQDHRKKFVSEIIESNPDFNKELSDAKNSILLEKEKQHHEVVEKMLAEYKATNPTHKCPVCGSTNLSAISTVGKIAKISLLGVWGAGDLGKKTRCNSCGHKF